MMIKVCGMRQEENIQALQQLDIDFMGLIRYPKSKRYVSDADKEKVAQLTMNKGTIGVYVNETLEQILKDVIPLELDAIQLHGDEDVAFAKALLELDLKVFKAIQITPAFDFSRLAPWQELALNHPAKFFFLFDTATPEYGGSGKQFEWKQLEQYSGQVPFLLSGGIGPQDVEKIKALDHEMLLGVDLNSKFEDAPAVKNIEAIKQFIKEIRNE